MGQRAAAFLPPGAHAAAAGCLPLAMKSPGNAWAERQRPQGLGSDGFGQRDTLAQGLGGVYHMLQRGNHFGPLACLEAAVGIDPEAFGGNALCGLLHELQNVCLGGNIGRVDVVDPGPISLG